MKISEIFFSIQGEGGLTGVPSIFIRTSGCNLRCQWCDTPYASWEPEGNQMTVTEILDAIAKYSCSHVVLTGGEPMIATAVSELATELRQLKKHITIETAGTIAPDEIECDLVSISPKLDNSFPESKATAAQQQAHNQLRWQPGIIDSWIKNYDYQIKYVIASETDISEIQQQLSSLTADIPPDRVMLMPEGTSIAALDSHQGAVTNLCQQYGYRYCDRLQIRLYGNRRGT